MQTGSHVGRKKHASTSGFSLLLSSQSVLHRKVRDQVPIMRADPEDIYPSSPGDLSKDGIIHIEDTKGMSKSEKIEAIDAIAENPNVSLETFAHLDINRILRKIDIRLIPMLTVLVCAVFWIFQDKTDIRSIYCPSSTEATLVSMPKTPVISVSDMIQVTQKSRG